MREWDAFISHAWEDKAAVARPLATALVHLGATVWYDEIELSVGDSLNESINRGLAQSRFGVVILSHHFFAKHWPKAELNGFSARESVGRHVILPVWHGLKRAEIAGYSPILADKLAATTDGGIPALARELARRILRPLQPEPTTATISPPGARSVDEPRLRELMVALDQIIASASLNQPPRDVGERFRRWRETATEFLSSSVDVSTFRVSAPEFVDSWVLWEAEHSKRWMNQHVRGSRGKDR